MGYRKSSFVRHFQWEFKFNIWCGSFDGYLLRPCELPSLLNGDLYLNFLQIQLTDLLDDLPLNLRSNMYFMQEDALAHFTLPVRNYLNTHFPDRWIGSGSEMSWPARCPDFNSMDFCVYMKSLVYEDTINTREELREKNEIATQSFQYKH